MRGREPVCGDDIIDSRDVIKRIDELESERADLESEAFDDTSVVADEHRAALAEWDEDNGDELKSLKELTDQCEGYSDWRHGVVLIHESYFEKYAQELAEDIGAINRDASWPNNCIDWGEAADELKADYTVVEWDGATYYFR